MQNFSFFESGEKGFTSARKCDILMKSSIEVWLSLVEHYVRDVGAASSNLVTSTIENARSFGKFPVAACFVLSGGSLKFVRHLCAAISKAHEKAGQNITRNRRRSYSTSGRFSFYACSLSFHVIKYRSHWGRRAFLSCLLLHDAHYSTIKHLIQMRK